MLGQSMDARSRSALVYMILVVPKDISIGLMISFIDLARSCKSPKEFGKSRVATGILASL
jgi:hypothetical protein